jgi:uncharacterized protein (TIGR02246 family)
VAVFSLPALASAGSQECAASLSARDAQAVRDVLEAYRSAWLRGDAKGVLATLSPDAVLLPAHGAAPVVGTAAITQYWWPPDAPPTTITRLDITVEHLGGDCQVAFASGHDDVWWTVVENGVTKTHGHPGTYLDVFVRMPDGVWRIARHMWDDGPSQ